MTILGGLVATLQLVSLAGLPADTAPAQDAAPPDVSIDAPRVTLTDVPFVVTLTSHEGTDTRFRIATAGGRELATGAIEAADSVRLNDLRLASRSELPLTVTLVGPGGSAEETIDPNLYPGWISLLPPLIAILLALIFREVVISLFFGVWLGAFFYAGLNPLSATWRAIDSFVVPSLADPSNAAILVFSLLLGGMVGVMSRAGGTGGIVEAVRPIATTPRRAQLATYLGGLAIFFDDYANTLIVGNTFRPITDRLRVSREKLAYIVDSTAAPVVAIVFVSTWVGYEISLIGQGLEIAAGQPGTSPEVAAGLSGASPFIVFVHSIPYLFYPILALVLVGLIVATQRDFGPMWAAERRARKGDGLYREDATLMVDTGASGMQPEDGTPLRWYNAAIPVLTVVLTVLLGLYFDGRAALAEKLAEGEAVELTLMNIFGEANPFNALLWGALAGCIVAIALALGQRILNLHDAIGGWVAGMRAMMLAFVILVLAWSLGEVTTQLGTAPFLTGILQGNLAPELLPAIVFVTAAAIAFATGTSWATMAILLPLVVPLIVSMGGAVGFETGESYTLLLGVVSSVLAGSIFGDHCSPISDTTVLSSMASACDHMDHVRTQLPYALVAGVTGVLVGDLATAYGMPWWTSYVLGIGILLAVLRFFGRRVDETEVRETESPEPA